jgi:thiamine transport system permease protein
MIRRRSGFAAAWLACLGILLFVAVPISGLIAAAQVRESTISLSDPYVLQILRFTLLQAVLSAVLSIALAIPIARALAKRQKFAGRDLLLRLFAVPLGLPQLVAVLGLISVYGRQGWLNSLFESLALPALPPLFGLKGILLAHVFFNMPLATRFLLVRLDAVPQEYWRLAASLGFPPRSVFRLIEWPYMRTVLPGVFALIFMLCVTSFTVVLTLGGGPQATTLEVAIYQALRFDFDPVLAARLAGLQILLCALLLIGLQGMTMGFVGGARLRASTIRPDSGDKTGKAVDLLLIGCGALLVVLPLAAILWDGLAADIRRLAGDATLWRAAMWSLILGLSAAVLATVTASTLARAIARSQGTSALIFRMAGNLVLLIPPLVLAAGLFLLVHRFVDPQRLAPYAIIAINAIMALPFALAVTEPAFRGSFLAHDRLADSLGLKGISRFRLVEWPVMKRSLALGFLVALLVSIGDFGIIAFFGNEELITLPLFLYQRIGSYRFNDAAAIALVLLLVCLALSWIIERHSRTETRLSQ